MKTNILLSLFLLCVFSVCASAQCTLPMPGRAPAGWFISSVQSTGAVPQADYYPGAGLGSTVNIYGYFPGLNAQNFFAGSAPSSAQGLTVYVDNACRPANFVHISSSLIVIQMPDNYVAPNNVANLYIVKNNLVILYGQVYNLAVSPIFYWKDFNATDQPNVVSAQIFKKSPQNPNLVFVGVVTPGVSIGQGVAPSDDLFIMFNMQGWNIIPHPFNPVSTYQVSFNGVNSPSMLISNATSGPYTPGTKLVMVQVPNTVRGSEEILKTMVLTVGGIETGLNPVLKIK